MASFSKTARIQRVLQFVEGAVDQAFLIIPGFEKAKPFVGKEKRNVLHLHRKQPLPEPHQKPSPVFFGLLQLQFAQKFIQIESRSGLGIRFGSANF